MGVLPTIGLGLAGSFLGGVLARLFLGVAGGLVFSVLGGAVVLYGYRRLVQKRGLTGPSARTLPPR